VYIGHARLSVCVSVCLSVCPSPHSHYCTDPDVSWGNGRECPLVVHCLADLQSVHGFRCYDNIYVGPMQAYSIIHYKCTSPNANDAWSSWQFEIVNTASPHKKKKHQQFQPTII